MKYSPLKDFRLERKKIEEIDNVEQLKFDVYRIWYKLPDETRPPFEISTD
ncbi:MAG: hypothetical protein QXV16_01760 [Candidatus Anstonellales archaeon]